MDDKIMENSKEKTLYEIFTDIRDEKEIPIEELRLAVLAYRDLLWFANKDVEKLSKLLGNNAIGRLIFDRNVRRYKNTLGLTPKTWLGKGETPRHRRI